MNTMLYYIYDEETRGQGPVHQKLYIGTVEEAIGWCLKIKDTQKITPVGFSIITYDDDDEMIDKNRYFFNGKIITKDNVPYNWNYTKMLKDYKKLIYINDNFCLRNRFHLTYKYLIF